MRKDDGRNFREELRVQNDMNEDQLSARIKAEERARKAKRIQEQRKKQIKERGIGGAISALAAGLAVGGIALGSKGVEQEKVSSIKQAIEQGIQPKNMGISMKSAEYFIKLYEEIDNAEEIIEIVPKVEGYTIDLTKEKISNEYDVSLEDITLYGPTKDGDGPSIQIGEDARDFNIPSELKEAIYAVGDIQDLEFEIQNGEKGKEKIKEICKKGMEGVEQYIIKDVKDLNINHEKDEEGR